MKRIRIGKDFTVLWTILTNKVASSLDGRDLSLILHRPNHTEISLDFDLSEDTPNELRVRIAPEVQSSTGRYTLMLWENRGRNAQTVVDSVNAFELVPVTSMEYEDESVESNLEIYPTIELETANMQVGITGPGVPDGGEVGQVIVKISEKNYDTEWRDARTLYGPELDEERDRAEKAEHRIEESLGAESNRAKEAERANAAAIDEEKRRATAAERALSETIDNEGDTLRIMVDKLAQCVKSGATNESLDGMVRDMTKLGTGYDTLYSLATTLKSFLTASDVADTTINRWQEIESFLSNVADTDTLVGMLENLQSTITTNYRTEISNAVEAETRRAQSAEEANQKDIVDLAGELSHEQERAEAAETRLSKNLTDEIARAKNAEKANAAAILEETNRAKSVESDLSESIQSENNRAVDAEVKLKKRIDETQEGLSTETSRATGEEAAIRQEFAASDATTLQSAKNYTDNRETAVRADLATNDAETLQSAKDYTDAVRQDERDIRQEAEQTVLTSAKKYTDVSLAAESADREAADKDVLEQAKQHTDTGIAAERVVREAAEREIQEAVTNYVNQKVAELVNGSPEALDTLLEISEALGNNPNFAADILAQLGEKVNNVEGKGLSTEDYTTPEKSKLAGIADGATNVSVKRELGRGTKIATISINGTAYDIYCQTNVDTTYSAGTGINLDGTRFSLSPSGVIEGTYGPATDVTGNEGQTISVPQITVDQYGRVTSVTNRLLTNKNTTYGTATPSTDGLMSAADKKNLDAFDGKKADKTVRIVAGTGLTGGGTLSSNVTLSLEEVATEGTYTKVHVDAQGRVNQGENLGVSDIPNLSWSKITSGKPTTLAGYGITDAVTLNTEQKIMGVKTFVSDIIMGAGSEAGNKIYWGRITDFAQVWFKNASDDDADSYLGFQIGDNGNKYFRFSTKLASGSADMVWATIKSNGITANGFIKSGGTASQFLKADGSVDGTSYLPRSGGTMTGLLSLKFNEPSPIHINTLNSKEGGIRISMNDISKGWVGYNVVNGSSIYNYACVSYLGIKDNGTPHFNGSTLWHEGNDGSGSGLDADKIDGKHLAEILSSNVASSTNADKVDGKHIAVMTAAQYAALTTKDANTLYIITD